MMSKAFKEGIERGAEQVTQAIKETLPKVQFNKNGYEIRTQALDMAKQWNEFEYAQKWLGFETSTKRDPNSGEFVTTVGMPQIPGVDQVLETAEKFYDFINNTKK